VPGVQPPLPVLVLAGGDTTVTTYHHVWLVAPYSFTPPATFLLSLSAHRHLEVNVHTLLHADQHGGGGWGGGGERCCRTCANNMQKVGGRYLLALRTLVEEVVANLRVPAFISKCGAHYSPTILLVPEHRQFRSVRFGLTPLNFGSCGGRSTDGEQPQSLDWWSFII
jgi:hypothetical protein